MADEQTIKFENYRAQESLEKTSPEIAALIGIDPPIEPPRHNMHIHCAAEFQSMQRLKSIAEFHVRLIEALKKRAEEKPVKPESKNLTPTTASTR